jgi:glycosyltransferase involved in cell wall biosynthesis
MHLALNVTDIGRQRGGNESYLLGLIDGLRSLPAVDDRFSLIACREGLPDLSAIANPDRFRVIDTGPYRRWPSYLWQQTQAIRRAQADWYVSTFLLPPLVPCRAAVLIHDLSFRAHPDYFPRSIALYMRVLVGAALRRAEVVVALSEFTRREIERVYPWALCKTVVVYPGIDRAFSPADDGSDDSTRHIYGVTQPYLLAVGNIHPRKNLARLLDAYEQLRARRDDLPVMVWAGVERWGSDELRTHAQAVGVQLTGRVEAAHLPALYRGAQALIYPSLYEGFGLPPVEAMACGTPVITSNTTSLPEAVDNAALTFDPVNVDQLANTIERIICDAALRAELRQRGLAQAARFDWTTTAAQLMRNLRQYPQRVDS